MAHAPQAAPVPAEPPTHLWALLVATVLLALALGAALIEARAFEQAAIDEVAWAENMPQRVRGLALQERALATPGQLLVFGSSELVTRTYSDLGVVFRGSPTGFTVFPVGYNGRTSLTMLQNIAALGPALRGKQVVVSVSPGWFIIQGVDDRTYAGNYSRLHGHETIFGTALSLELRQAAARRMVTYPATLRRDLLLRLATERLAAGQPADLAVYTALWPLGRLTTEVVRLQDHWETRRVVTAWREKNPARAPQPQQRPGELSWTTILLHGERMAQRESSNNAFGFDNDRWVKRFEAEARLYGGTLSDADFLENLTDSAEWTDYDLLLSALREVGAEPLLLAMPWHGAYYNHLGVSVEARAVYYRRIADATEHHALPLRNFAEHDMDTLFLRDPNDHLSPKGWTVYAQVIDAFVHRRLS